MAGSSLQDQDTDLNVDAEVTAKADENRATGTENTDGKGGTSSTATEDDKQTQMVDAVKAALDKTGKGQTSGSADGEEEGDAEPKPAAKSDKKDGATEGDEELGELTEDELKNYRPRTQRRMRQLMDQRNAALEEVKMYGDAADRMGTFEAYCRSQNLEKDDISSGFTIMALMKNDPAKAYELLTPIYQTLQKAVGDVLPDELQARVEAGEISQEDALTISRSGSRLRLTEAQRQAEATRIANERVESERRELENLGNETGRTMSEWERSWQARDPDYRVKQPRVQEKIELDLHRRVTAGTLPKSVAEARAIGEKALREVNDEMKRFAPKKAAHTPVTGVGTSTSSTPKPRSSIEAVQQGLSK